MRSLGVLLVAAALTVAEFEWAAPAGAATSDSLIVSQAEWILQAQLPDGAIAVWPDRPELRLIWPYLANQAAAGLARATEVTGNGTYADHAWAYLSWYASVEAPVTGYVTDYTIVDGTTPESNGNIDSTDAYAGTFLSAAWDTYHATGDLARLRRLAAGIAGALHAIESTQQPDGLTWAKPDYQVSYLMDDAQAYNGLEGAADLESALGNSTLEARAAADGRRMKAGIAALWDPATHAYDWAVDADGVRHTTDWANFYPDSMEQMSAVLWGAVTGSQAAALIREVVDHHPDWDQPTALDLYLNDSTVDSQPVSYWPSMAAALANAGQAQAGASGLSSVMSAASAVEWVWPYTTGDAGNAIVAASGEPYLDPTVAVTTGSAALLPATAARGGSGASAALVAVGGTGRTVGARLVLARTTVLARRSAVDLLTAVPVAFPPAGSAGRRLPLLPLSLAVAVALFAGLVEASRRTTARRVPAVAPVRTGRDRVPPPQRRHQPL